MKCFRYGWLLCFIAMGCSTSEGQAPPIHDPTNLRDPHVLKGAVKDKLSAEAQALLEKLEISTGGTDEIDFLVSVRGVIASQNHSQEIQQAIEEAVSPTGGKVEWLVTSNPRQKPAEPPNPDAGTVGQ